jgi:integrase
VALAWTAEQVKARRAHEIPLTGRAQEIVQELWDNRRLGCPLFHVEGRRLGGLKTEWRRACRLAGVGAFRLHDMRRSFLTNVAAAGVPDTVARSLSGHRTAAVHARYQITQEATKIAALSSMEVRVGNLHGHSMDTAGVPGHTAESFDAEKLNGYKALPSRATLAQSVEQLIRNQ